MTRGQTTITSDAVHQGADPTVLVREGTARLRAAGVGPARAEAEWLLSRLTGVRPLELYLDGAGLAPGVPDAFRAQIAERAAGRPLQYLLGEAAFFGRAFDVRPGVFIPRPETEAVLAQALPALRALAPDGGPLRVVDAGTGSGCIAVTLACELPACLVLGVEVSWDALQTARRNLRRHGVEGCVGLVQGAWLDAVGGTWDALIANPPYVPAARIDGLPRDVRQEPRQSLDGGTAGLDALRRLLAEARRLIRPGGALVLECGEDQVAILLDEARQGPWGVRRPLHDLAGRPRGVLLARATSQRS